MDKKVMRYVSQSSVGQKKCPFVGRENNINILKYGGLVNQIFVQRLFQVRLENKRKFFIFYFSFLSYLSRRVIHKLKKNGISCKLQHYSYSKTTLIKLTFACESRFKKKKKKAEQNVFQPMKLTQQLHRIRTPWMNRSALNQKIKVAIECYVVIRYCIKIERHI